MVVKEDADTVGFVLWQHLLGAPCFRAGFCSKTIIPDSEEHPLASSRAVPKDVLRWIRDKRESHVPLPLRRTINRVAALLETVDLEFDRVLAEREKYVEGLRNSDFDGPLDTENLRGILEKELPDGESEEVVGDYGSLLDALLNFGIADSGSFTGIIRRQREAALRRRSELTREFLGRGAGEGGSAANTDRRSRRLDTRLQLARIALSLEFGDDFRKFVRSFRQAGPDPQAESEGN